MKNDLIFLLILPLIFVAFSCDKGDENTDFDCKTFEVAVINIDSAKVDRELLKLLKDSEPLPVTNDPIGQQKNMESLVQHINECGLVNAELKCYACIKTNPPQSEILIRVDSAGISGFRVISISTPGDNKLKFLNIHRTFVL